MDERLYAEQLIVRHEGEKLHAYQDSLGYLTIGIGRLIDKRRGGGISKAESRMLFSNDLDAGEKALDIKVPWWRAMSPARQAVLLDMAFQLGIGELMEFHQTLTAMQAGNYELAARRMLASLAARQTPERWQENAQIMRSGEFKFNERSGQ